MAKTRADLRTEVYDNAGLAEDEPRLPAATLNRFLNRANRRIAMIHDWPWNEVDDTLTTVADQLEYNTPTGWQKTRAMTLDNIDLQRISVYDQGRFNDLRGKPRAYFIAHDQIHLYPTPDGAYDIVHHFHGSEVDMDEDTDEPNLPEKFIDVLVAQTTIFVATRLRDSELYALAAEERREALRRMDDDADTSTQALLTRTRSDWRLGF